jgi:uroporphyrinogen-III synthase
VPPLEGRRIALLESRKSSELAALVQRLGGTVVSAPSVREVPQPDEVDAFITGLAAVRFDVTIFLTGVGITALLDEADRRGVLPQTRDALSHTTIACRGPKPIAALRKYGLTPQVTTTKPHTSRELLDALDVVTLRDARVLLVHYGERNADLAAALRARGARLDEVCPYVWAFPEDVGPLQSLVKDTIDGRLDAMLFTSQVQCRHLFEVARASGLEPDLSEALRRDVVVGAVGPVCADALRGFGVIPDVIPAAPNMASLMTALGDYFELTGEADRP